MLESVVLTTLIRLAIKQIELPGGPQSGTPFRGIITGESAFCKEEVVDPNTLRTLCYGPYGSLYSTVIARGLAHERDGSVFVHFHFLVLPMVLP